MASSKLGNAFMALMIKQMQPKINKTFGAAEARQVTQFGQDLATGLSPANSQLFAKELATPIKKKTPVATAPVSQSKRQRTAGAQLLKRRKRPQGKVRRPKASTIPITKENQLG
jgi:hypothetical protein